MHYSNEELLLSIYVGWSIVERKVILFSGGCESVKKLRNKENYLRGLYSENLNFQTVLTKVRN